MSQGEYIAVENVEGKYLACTPFLQQVLIHGDSQEDFVVAIVVPEPESFAIFASEVLKTKVELKDPEAYTKICQDPKVVKAVRTRLNRNGKKAGLKG